MTEFENQQGEFNEIQSEYLSNKEYGIINEKIKDLEEFYNEVKMSEEDKKINDSNVQSGQNDLSAKLSSIQGEAAAKGVTASISSSMGTAVSAIALCVASVGVNASYSDSNNSIQTVESPVEIVQEKHEYIYNDVEEIINDIVAEDEQNEIQSEEIKKLEHFEAPVENYIGVYDGNGHSGNPVNIPDGAVITYGESMDSCVLSEVPQFTDAGDYTVYYKVSKEGYEPYYGSYTITIEKGTVITPDPSVQELIYNGKAQSPNLNENVNYKYSGIMSAENVGTYKLKLELTDPKNYMWTDGSSEDKLITWVIKPRELTIEWNGQKSNVYNGKRHVIDVTLGNVIPGDFLNFTVVGNSAREPGIYTAEVISVRGSENYVLPKQCSYNWEITQD